MTPKRDWAEFNPETDLRIARHIAAPVDLVWRAWTDPEHLRQWFVPKPWSIAECELDVRPGGIFRTVMQSPDGAIHDEGAGIFLDVVEREWLVWTSALQPGYRPAPEAKVDCGFAMTAGIEFRPEGAGTHYVATVLHADRASRERHEEMGFHEGWGTVIDQLAAHVQGLKEKAQ